MTKLSKYILAPVSGVLLSLPFSAKAQNLMPSGSPLYKLPYKRNCIAMVFQNVANVKTDAYVKSVRFRQIEKTAKNYL
jgi:hypothetical protein